MLKVKKIQRKWWKRTKYEEAFAKQNFGMKSKDIRWGHGYTMCIIYMNM